MNANPQRIETVLKSNLFIEEFRAALAREGLPSLRLSFESGLRSDANLACVTPYPEKLVISGETGARVLRGMIPRRGAVAVTIQHADEPGVLVPIMEALRKAEVNVLSSLLKRGKAAPKNAILVAVCEPLARSAGNRIEQAIQRELRKLPQEFRVAREPEFNYGRDPRRVVYSRHPDEIIARVPSDLRARVLEIRENLKTNKPRIFLSRRFGVGARADEYAEKIRKILDDLGCAIVEAPVRPCNQSPIPIEVAAAMWASQAGIVLGAVPESEDERAVSLNIAHEYAGSNSSVSFSVLS